MKSDIVKLKTKRMENNDFTCDECGAEFSVGKGFLGSLDDFEFVMSDRNEKIDDFECSPFMNYVQLCDSCYTLRLESDGKVKAIHKK